MEAVQSLLRLPPIRRIPSADELDAALLAIARRDPRRWRVERIGTTPQGRPLWNISVGTAQRHALIIGGPHANEPVGALTILHLAKLVADHPDMGEDRTWNFIPCLDPDGARRMGRHWHGRPSDIGAYHRGFYRPPMAEHPEAAFDGDRPGRPAGTLALIELYRELRPYVQCSLHNADFGGAFYILGRDQDGLPEALRRLTMAGGVPLALSHADTFGWPSPAEGVFVRPPAISRAHVSAYAAAFGTFTFVPEVPVWMDVRSTDPSPYGRPYRDTLMGCAASLGADMDALELMAEADRDGWALDPAIRAAFTDTLAIGRRFSAAWRHLAVSGRHVISVAEAAAITHARHSMRLRAFGLFLRPRRDPPPAWTRLFRYWCEVATAEISPRPMPLQALVTVQLGAVLAACASPPGGGSWPAWRP